MNPHSAALLRQLTLVDGRRHVAWVAVLPGDDGGDQVVGEARYVREGAHDAELALSVADAWRGRGVADALMAALTDHARQAGVAQLRAEVQPDNGRMQAFVQRRGFGPASCDGGVQVCVLSLARVPAQKRLPRRAWKAWQACQALWARMQPSRARLALQIPQQPA